MVFSVNAMMTNAANTSSGRGANNRRRIQSSLEATTSWSSFVPRRRRRRVMIMSSPFSRRGGAIATMRMIGEGRTGERKEKSERRRMDAAATATSTKTNASTTNPEGGYAWRGDPIPTKSLPLLPNGKVDYSSIDKSPISKVLTSTIRIRETTRILKR